MPPVKVHALVDSLGGGGAELLLAELAQVAPEAGIELTVGYLMERGGSPGAARLRAAGVEPQPVGVKALGLAAVRDVRRQLRAVSPQIVHTHLGYADLLGGVAARSLGIPAVSTLHAMRWDFRPRRERTKVWLFATARRRCMTRVVAVSDAARRHYLKAARIPPERLVTIPNGIVGTPAPGAGRELRSQLGLEPDAFVVAIVAALRPEKSHAAAAVAFADLRDAVPGARLLVVGDGPARAEVRRALAPLGGAAVMAGHRDDVMAVLDAADVLLHVPLYDALPTAVIEAMAAGVPVVGARVGGVPELVEDGVTGVLVGAPPRSGEVTTALAALAADADGRARMADAARRRFEERFSAIAWARRLRALYAEILEAGR